MKLPGLRAVERYTDPKLSNHRASRVTLVEQVRNANVLTNLTGAGEIVGVFDTGLDKGDSSGTGVPPPGSMHPDFDGRVVLLANIHSPANSTADAQVDPVTPGNRNDHGTHVVGTIAGNGARSNGRVRGVAPASGIILHSVNDPDRQWAERRRT